MPVVTRSSSVPATRSRDRKKPGWVPDVSISTRRKAAASLSGSRKARKPKVNATQGSQSVSRASHVQATSSSSSTRLERDRQGQEVSEHPHASTILTTRAPAAAIIPAPVEVSRTSSRSLRTSFPTAHPLRRRAADPLDGAVPDSQRKRKRRIPAVTDRAEACTLIERESAVSEREVAVSKREVAMNERELAVQTLEDLKNTNKQLEQKIRKLKREVKNTEKRSEQARREGEGQLKQVKREWKAKVDVLAVERDMLVEMCKAAKNESKGVAASRLPGVGVNLQWILLHLEEHYQCSLCFEIMASPYALNNGRCGHAYCAICILKWAFAAVHRDCGYWHEALECPLCRATLPLTPDATPRNIYTFPFVPERLADAAIKSYLAILQDAADSKSKPIASRDERGRGDIHWYGEIDEQVITWGQGQASRTEWEQRERVGKTQMTALFDNWSHNVGEDLIALKDYLEAA